MIEDLVVQTELERPTDTGSAMLIVWLPRDPRVKVGSVISLKGETERWTVRRQFTALPMDLVRYKGWNVGGLG